MTRQRLGKSLIALISVVSILVPFIVDFNDTHLFNPAWPPHARLHDAMSFLMSAALGGVALWVLFARTSEPHRLIRMATVLAVAPWVALVSAGFFPGTAFMAEQGDQAAFPAPQVLGLTLYPNVVISLLCMGLCAVGYWLARPQRPAP